MADTIKLARTATYEHTISGLLTKRADLFNEAQRIRDRLAEIKNDIGALDRVLGTLGYTGNLDAEMPRQKRQVLFGPGELTRAILDVLRDATEPMATREIARAILAVNEQDPRDRRLLTEHTRRVSKALRILKRHGAVVGAGDKGGNMLWEKSRKS
ncbi:hypothetical protein HUN39_01815 [Methylocystis sp. FS]|uniref:hypothetical protein n=1 Tax=Methylocystis silviterrae TaxID=2743612 RepID=UPI0015842969|nr:hypothetical protein [Methylocystis silviterrae]NUJ78786.1 hypothetical protein [Methylocystis silviterrae]